MNEPLVSHPLAVALKVAGFNWPVINYFHKHLNLGILEEDAEEAQDYNHGLSWHTSRPTLSHAAQWLIETQNMYVNVDTLLAGKWGYIVRRVDNGKALHHANWAEFSDYKTALTSGLLRACEIVKEKEGKL